MINKNDCLIKFEEITSHVKTIQQKRQQLIKQHGLTEDGQIMMELIKDSPITINTIKHTIKTKVFDYDMLYKLLELRLELIAYELEDLKKETIESSFIFEYTLFQDILDDLNYMLGVDNNDIN
mgnify:CR=1 FL=1